MKPDDLYMLPLEAIQRLMTLGRRYEDCRSHVQALEALADGSAPDVFIEERATRNHYLDLSGKVTGKHPDVHQESAVMEEYFWKYLAANALRDAEWNILARSLGVVHDPNRFAERTKEGLEERLENVRTVKELKAALRSQRAWIEAERPKKEDKPEAGSSADQGDKMTE